MSPEPLAALGFGASVRIVAHAVAIASPQVLRRRPWVKRSGWFARFEDDRDLTGLKVAIVGFVIVIVMLLEVPW